MKRALLFYLLPGTVLVLFVISLWSASQPYFYAPVRLLGELFSYDPDDEPLSLPQAEEGQQDTVRMVRISAGPFWAGIDDPQRGWARRQIHVDAFYIDVHEVTNRQYARFVEALDYPDPPFWEDPRYNGADLPVVGVNWYDARNYCWWTYKRLPTEAEWAKAARGAEGRVFPWGDGYRPAQANLLGDEDGHEGLAPAGAFAQADSPFGVHDMLGNVWEWCRDWYDPHFYRRGFEPNPAGPHRGYYRVLRGGSWVSSPEFAAGFVRDRLDPFARGVHFGFRCARVAD